MPLKKAAMPLLLLFVILNALLLTFKKPFERWEIDREMLIIANLLFFLVSIVALWIQSRSLGNKNPHAFVRSVMGSMMIRMVFVILGLVAYLMFTKSVNKPGIFISLFLYVLYLVVEVGIMMKMNRQSNG